MSHCVRLGAGATRPFSDGCLGGAVPGGLICQGGGYDTDRALPATVGTGQVRGRAGAGAVPGGLICQGRGYDTDGALSATMGTGQVSSGGRVISLQRRTVDERGAVIPKEDVSRVKDNVLSEDLGEHCGG